MARSLPSLQKQHVTFAFLPIKSLVNSVFIVLGVLSVLSIVTFLCGSHRREEKKTVNVRLGGKERVRRLQSTVSSRALHLAKMISWKKEQSSEKAEPAEEDDDGDDDQAAVWKRTIIKGERCRPLDFSGKISYDSKGNLLSD